MNKAVEYRGILLMPGSQAYELFHSKDSDAKKKLDKHMKEVEQRHKELIQRYDKE